MVGQISLVRIVCETASAGVNRETGFEGIIRLWRERFDDHIAKRQILFRWLTEQPFRASIRPTISSPKASGSRDARSHAARVSCTDGA